MNTARRDSCLCLLPSPSNPTWVLVEQGGDGCWRLPSIPLRGSWLPIEGEAVRGAFFSRFGVETTLLRHLKRRTASSGDVCLLECQHRSWQPPTGCRWMDLTKPSAGFRSPEGHEEVLPLWLKEMRSRETPWLRPAWERPGWVLDALAWARRELASLDITIAGPVAQLKAAWSGSALLRITTNCGFVYLKEVWRRPPGEAEMIGLCGELLPGQVPRILATGEDGRRFLMADFQGWPLDGFSVDRWSEALMDLARLQMLCLNKLPNLRRAGCPETVGSAYSRTLSGWLEEIPRRWPERWSPRLSMSIGRLLDEVEQREQRLWDSPIPATLVLQDFALHNLAIGTGGRTIFFDLNEAIVGHPFFSVLRFLGQIPLGEEFRRHASPEGSSSARQLFARPGDPREGLTLAYLAAWRDFIPLNRALEIFEEAFALAELHLALRWYGDLEFIEPGCPFHRIVEASMFEHLLRACGWPEELAAPQFPRRERPGANVG